MRLTEWCESHTSLVVHIMAQLDAQSLLNFDIAMQGAIAGFKSLFKKAQLPALCKYRYESDGLSGTMSKALSWVMTRECDVSGFILKVEGYKSPIFYAVDKGLYELAELLLTQGSIDGMPGVNDGEYSRTAPLHQAVYRQRVDLVTLLLAHGANPNAVGLLRERPLQLNLQVVPLLQLKEPQQRMLKATFRFASRNGSRCHQKKGSILLRTCIVTSLRKNASEPFQMLVYTRLYVICKYPFCFLAPLVV